MGSIEEEIKQKKFLHGKEKAAINIMYTSNWIRDRNAPIFKEYGILQQHYNILRIIRGKKGEPTTPGHIISVMLDKGRDLTRLVDKLVKIGYLERKTDEFNRRKVNIFLTKLGKDITDKIEVKLQNWYAEDINLEEGDLEQLNTLLDKFRG